MKISCEIIGKVDSGDVSKISMKNNNGVVNQDYLVNKFL